MNQPTTQYCENEIDNKYTWYSKFLEKNFQVPSRNRTQDLPITSLDALTTELQVTHMVSRSQALRLRLRTSHLTSTQDTNQKLSNILKK